MTPATSGASPAESGGQAVDHEAHGYCHACRYPAHEYPFGWQHVGSGMFSCSSLIPVATCCDEHGVGYRYIGPYGVPAFARHAHGLTEHQHDGGALSHEHTPPAASSTEEAAGDR